MFRDHMDCSWPGSSVHGISQARILKWVAISSSRGSSQPRDWTCIYWFFCIAGGFFYMVSHQGSSHDKYTGKQLDAGKQGWGMLWPPFAKDHYTATQRTDEKDQGRNLRPIRRLLQRTHERQSEFGLGESQRMHCPDTAHVLDAWPIGFAMYWMWM